MSLKKTVEVDDVASEGKAVAAVAAIFAKLEDQAAVERVAIAAGIICGL